MVLRPGELSRVPYAEPSASQGLPTAFYNESHHRFRADLRRFFDEEVMPDAVANDAQGKHPPIELWQRMGSAACSPLASKPALGSETSSTTVGSPSRGDRPGAVRRLPRAYIAHEGFCRLGVPGYCDGLGAGFVIGLPVLQFGSPAVATRVGREVLCGHKRHRARHLRPRSRERRRWPRLRC